MPTRENSILDLFLTSAPEKVKSVCLLEELSDHKVVLVTVDISIRDKPDDEKVIYDYAKANTAEIFTALEAFLGQFERDYRCRSIDENWTLIKETLLKLQNLNVPKIKIPSNVKKPWFSKSLNSLLNTKKNVSLSKQKKNQCYGLMEPLL